MCACLIFSRYGESMHDTPTTLEEGEINVHSIQSQQQPSPNSISASAGVAAQKAIPAKRGTTNAGLKGGTTRGSFTATTPTHSSSSRITSAHASHSDHSSIDLATNLPFTNGHSIQPISTQSRSHHHKHRRRHHRDHEHGRGSKSATASTTGIPNDHSDSEIDRHRSHASLTRRRRSDSSSSSTSHRHRRPSRSHYHSHRRARDRERDHNGSIERDTLDREHARRPRRSTEYPSRSRDRPPRDHADERTGRRRRGYVSSDDEGIHSHGRHRSPKRARIRRDESPVRKYSSKNPQHSTPRSSHSYSNHNHSIAAAPKDTSANPTEVTDLILDEDAESHEQQLIEERRKKRERILECFGGGGGSGKGENVSEEGSSTSVTGEHGNGMDRARDGKDGVRESPSMGDSAQSLINDSLNDQDDAAFDLEKGQCESSHTATTTTDTRMNAGDYNSENDDDKRQHVGKITSNSSLAAPNSPTRSQNDETKRTKGAEFDMFADDGELDMFAGPNEMHLDLMENMDDQEGYYRFTLGEILDKRFRVIASIGKGVFSTVVRVVDTSITDDTSSPKEYAIKIIRNNPTMYRAGVKELQLLQRIREADPDDKRHVIQLKGSFEHRNHLCIVFENLSMNLRQVLRKYGHNVGLNVKAVKVYSKQLFMALWLLQKCRVLHADIKPDNILVNERKNVLKLCDLGSAADVNENDITPYLVSRFYRAPEIILGLPYDHGIDMWSVGCTLYELYTGKILFPGRSNNAMLKYHQSLRGKIPHKVLRKGQLSSQHFSMPDLNFVDAETGKTLMFTTMQGNGEIVDDRDLNDLLAKCLTLNPEKRISVGEALRHAFVRK